MPLRGRINTDRVTLGTTPALDDLDPCTMAAWIWPETLGGAGRFYAKGVATAQRINTIVNVAQVFQSFRNRATTNLNVQGDWVNFACGATVLKWLFVAATQDSTTSANCRLFVGDLWNPPREPSSYRTQDAGTGTWTSNTGQVAELMNQSGVNNGMVTILEAWVGVWNRLLTPAELTVEQQRSKWGQSVLTPGLRGLWRPGEDGGVIVRDRSPFANHGTISGGTPEPRAPWVWEEDQVSYRPFIPTVGVVTQRRVFVGQAVPRATNW